MQTDTSDEGAQGKGFPLLREPSEPGSGERAPEAGESEESDQRSEKEPEPEKLDLLSEDPDDDEADEAEDEPEERKPVSYDRFAKENRAKRKWKDAALADREARTAAETQLTELHKEADALLELYGDYDDAATVAREDKAFMDVLQQHKRDPAIAPAIQFILSKLRGSPVTAGEPTVRPSERKPTAPARDPVVEGVVKDALETKTMDLLRQSTIRPEVHRAIVKGVLEGADIATRYTQDDLAALIRNVVRANGWSREFLVGKKPTRRAAPPTGGGREAASADRSQRGAKKAEGDTKPEQPKSLAELEQRTRTRFHALVEESLKKRA